MSDACEIKITPTEFLKIAESFYKRSEEYKKELEDKYPPSIPDPEIYVSIGDETLCVGVSWYPIFDKCGKIINF